MANRKGMEVGGAIEFMIGAFLVVILAFTWFFPTLNGATALNNSSTLWIGGTNYNWAVPIIAVVLIIAVVILLLKKAGIIGG
jgi:hypothetical protein